eukprot:TRINITY_DN17149_c0_g1_i11.p1 TRINITY_DN17149_c0_g1~~TRINITY_DN17149_c0_g1_i11.p1  ORF type:complete len:1738 (-),score=641.63 TRINITY_DN17149_c0_g1_i11:58-5271(-)
MLRSLVGSEMCIRDSINAEYGEESKWTMPGHPEFRIQGLTLDDDGAMFMDCGNSQKIRLEMSGDSRPDALGDGNITRSIGLFVIGDGTNFLEQVAPGATIAVDKQERVVTKVETAQSLMVDAAFDPPLHGEMRYAVKSSQDSAKKLKIQWESKGAEMVLGEFGINCPVADLDEIWVAWPTVKLQFPSLVMMEKFVRHFKLEPQPSTSMLSLSESDAVKYDASEETVNLWKQVEFLSQVLDDETRQKDEIKAKVEKVTAIEDLGGNLTLLQDVMPMLKDLNLQLTNGQLLGEQLPPGFDEKIQSLVQAHIQSDNSFGVLAALKTKAQMMEQSGTMTEEGRNQINQLLGQLQGMNASAAAPSPGVASQSLSERARAILDSKELSAEARAKLEALTRNMEQTAAQVEEENVHAAEIEHIRAQRQALKAKVDSFAGEMSEENRAKVMQLMAVLEAKEAELVAAGSAPNSKSQPAPSSAEASGEADRVSKEEAILSQINKALDDPETSEPTKEKLRAMKAGLLADKNAPEPEPTHPSDHQAQVVARARAALEDPETPVEKKVFIARMLKQMQDKEAAGSPAKESPPPAKRASPPQREQSPEPSEGRIEQLCGERTKVEARARAALADPNLPPEAKQEILGMLSQLKEQAAGIEVLEGHNEDLQRQSQANVLQSDVAAMLSRCDEALLDPDLGPEDRAHILQMKTDLKARLADLDGVATASAGRFDQSREELKARAAAALADPDLRDETKAALTSMLKKILLHDAMMQEEMESLNAAEQEAAVMRTELATADQDKAALKTEVERVLADPSLSAESRARLEQTYDALVHEQRQAQQQLQPKQPDEAEIELGKAAAVHAKCQTLLENPMVPEEKKAEIREFLHAMTQKEEQIRILQDREQKEAVIQQDAEEARLVRENSEMSGEVGQLASQLAAQEAERDRMQAMLEAARQQQEALREEVSTMRSQVQVEQAAHQQEATSKPPTHQEGELAAKEALELAVQVLQDPNVDQPTKIKVMEMVKELRSQMAEAEEVEAEYVTKQAEMTAMAQQRAEIEGPLSESLSQLQELRTVRDQARASARATLAQEDLPDPVRQQITDMLAKLDAQVAEVEQATLAAHKNFQAQKSAISAEMANMEQSNPAAFQAAVSAQEAEQHPQFVAQHQQAVALATKILSDPAAPPEVKAQVRGMLESLEEQSEAVKHVEAAAHASEDMDDVERLELGRQLAAEALSDPHMSEEAKIQIRAILATHGEQVEAPAPEPPKSERKKVLAERAYEALASSGMSEAHKSVIEEALAELQGESDEEADEADESEDEEEQMAEAEMLQAKMNALAAEKAALMEAKERLESQIKVKEEERQAEEPKPSDVMASDVESKAQAILSNPSVPESMKSEIREMLARAKELRGQLPPDMLDDDEEADEAAEEEQAAALRSRIAAHAEGKLKNEMTDKARAMLADPNVPESMKSDVRRVLNQATQMESQVQHMLDDPSVPEETKLKVRTMLAEAQEEQRQMEAAAEAEEEERRATAVEKVEQQAHALLSNPNVPDEVKLKVSKMLADARAADFTAKERAADAMQADAESALSEVRAVEEEARAILANPSVPESMKAQVRSMLQKAEHLNHLGVGDQETVQDDQEMTMQDDPQEAAELQAQMQRLAAEKARLVATKQSLEAQIQEKQALQNSQLPDDQMAVMQEAARILADPCLLYTSDAADEEDSVDLGGRRIIKKKKKKKIKGRINRKTKIHK